MKYSPWFILQKLFCITFLFSLLAAWSVSAQDGTKIQITKPKVTNLIVQQGLGGQKSFTVESNVPLDLSSELFVLSNPNRIVIDFTGATPANLFMSRCHKASSQEITVRCGRHFDFTRMVLDFGQSSIPEFYTLQQEGNITLFLTTEPTIQIKEIGQLEQASPELKEPEDQDGGDIEEPLLTIGDPENIPGETPDRSIHFNGYLTNRFFHDTREENIYESDSLNHFKAITNFTYDNNSTLSAQLGLIFNMYSDENNGDWQVDSDLCFHETYINLLFGAGNIRVGNQIVRWGKTDGFSPLDNINPEDFRAGIAGRREERKLPLPMVNIEYDLFNTTLQGIYIPGFFKSELDIVGSDWSLFGNLPPSLESFAHRQEDHNQFFNNPEYGVRTSATIGSMDIALNYLSTKSDTPVIGSLIVPPGFSVNSNGGSLRDLVPFGVATSQAIPLRYPRQNIYGFEFETTYSNFGIRGDVAYFEKKSYLKNTLAAIEKPVFHYILGADYLSASDFYINLQFSHSIILDYNQDILYQEEHSHAIIATFSQILFNGDVKLELRSFYDLSGDAAMYNPRVVIKRWDNLSLEAGGELFYGKPYTLFGMYEENDQLYCEVSYAF